MQVLLTISRQSQDTLGEGVTHRKFSQASNKSPIYTQTHSTSKAQPKTKQTLCKDTNQIDDHEPGATIITSN